MDRLHISDQQLEQIRNELEREAPGEACGILVGRIVPGYWFVEEVIPTSNVRRELDRFEVDPHQLLEIWIESERNNKDIVGFYHTHPSSKPIPSKWDIEGMRHNPVVWLIVSREDEGAFLWKDGPQGIEVERGV